MFLEDIRYKQTEPLRVNAIWQAEGPSGVQVVLVAVERDVDFEVIEPFLIVGPDHRQDRAEGELASEAFRKMLVDDV